MRACVRVGVRTRVYWFLPELVHEESLNPEEATKRGVLVRPSIGNAFALWPTQHSENGIIEDQ